MWPANTDDLPQVSTAMCIETVKLYFRQAPRAHVVRKYTVQARRMLSRAVAADEG